MDTQCTTAAVEEDLKVAPGLRGFDDTKGIFLARHLNVIRVVACDLEKNSVVAAALVCLPRGVQETRAEPETCGDAISMQHIRADRFEEAFVLGRHFDICEQAEVVARADVIEV